jgi:hypothetical protein
MVSRGIMHQHQARTMPCQRRHGKLFNLPLDACLVLEVEALALKLRRGDAAAAPNGAHINATMHMAVREMLVRAIFSCRWTMFK